VALIRQDGIDKTFKVEKSYNRMDMTGNSQRSLKAIAWIYRRTHAPDRL